MNQDTLLAYLFFYMPMLYLLSYIVYRFSFFTVIRVVIALITIYSSLSSLYYGNTEHSLIMMLFLSHFIKRFIQYIIITRYRNQDNNKAIVNIILSPLQITKSILANTTRYFVAIIDGTISERRKLNKEKEEFKQEKQRFQAQEAEIKDEWENIKKAWEELIREREEYYNNRDSNSNYSNSRSSGYERARSYTNRANQERNKKQSGKYFADFSRFDLDDFDRNNAYEVLGVSSGANKKEVLQAWRKLMLEFHPDRFMAEDNIEKIKEAEQIAKLINWAKGKIG